MGKINLGFWIANQRIRVLPESERGRLLSQIGMHFFDKRINLKWEKMYEYACIYYEHHKNLEIPRTFKTNNGFEYDEQGKIKLGYWLSNQRQNTLLESERGQLLSQIGMRFERKISTLSWEEMYEYACIYYEHHKNLEIPYKFKTNNGFEYNEKGSVNLGIWIANQRKNVSRESEHGQLLYQIGMRFSNKKSILSWKEMYEYARIYYEHHKSLEIPRTFKTNNGFEYDEQGKIKLGYWLSNQRQNTLLESERGQLLSQIGMRFERKISTLSWEEMYEYACIYYEHHKNLEIPYKFKTSNGFEYNEKGSVNLGIWMANQRKTVSRESERGQLLYQIGMRFERKISTLSWEEMYEYACIYYKHYGRLEVPTKFKTNNGWEEDELGKINLGPWIAAQKQLYKNKEMSEEQIILLENIGMKWMSEKVDNKLQMEEITEKNTRKKQIELLNRTKSLLNHIDNQVFESMKDINQVNQQFINELNRKSR